MSPRVMVMQRDGRYRSAVVLARWFNCLVVKYEDGAIHVTPEEHVRLPVPARKLH